MPINRGSSQAKQDDLTALEATIGRGLTSYRDVGHALAEIKSRKLYRVTEHRTWHGYCAARWGMSDGAMRIGKSMLLAWPRILSEPSCLSPCAFVLRCP